MKKTNETKPTKNKKLTSFSKNLKQLRLEKSKGEKKLSQTEFAEDILKISYASLSGYETGMIQPNLEMLIKIAKACDVSLDWLCGLSTKRNADEIKTNEDLIHAIEEMEQSINPQICLRQCSPDKAMLSIELFDNDIANIYKQIQENKRKLKRGTIDETMYDAWYERVMEEYNTPISKEGSKSNADKPNGN